MASSSKSSKKASSAEEQVIELPLDQIDPDDTYCFRMSLNVKALVEDIGSNGQDFPIIVRKRGKESYQLICGFRRTTALSKLERTTAKAIVRELTDDEALRLAWAENQQRRSYTDLDRAHAVLKAQQSGKSMAELEKVFGLGRKQLQRLKKLAKTPKLVQDAVAESKISTSHAIVLNELGAKHEKLDLKRWIEAIVEEELSIRQLRRRINKEQRSARSVQFFSEEDGVLRLRAVKLDPEKLGDEERAALKDMVQRLMALAGE